MMIGGLIVALIAVAMISKNVGVLKRAKSRGTRAGAYVMIATAIVVFALGMGMIYLGSAGAMNR